MILTKDNLSAILSVDNYILEHTFTVGSFIGNELILQLEDDIHVCIYLLENSLIDGTVLRINDIDAESSSIKLEIYNAYMNNSKIFCTPKNKILDFLDENNIQKEIYIEFIIYSVLSDTDNKPVMLTINLYTKAK